MENGNSEAEAKYSARKEHNNSWQIRNEKEKKTGDKTWQREIWILTGSLTEKIQDV